MSDKTALLLSAKVCSTLAMDLDVDKIKDAKELRELARLALRENAVLHKQLEKLANRIDKLEGKDASELQKQIKGLKRKLNKEKNKNSAPRSERRKGHRGKKKRPEDKKPETGGKRTEQPELAFVEATSTLNDSDRRCEKCNGVATPIAGGDTTEVVTVIERIFRIKSVTRQKYVHGCNCKAVEKFVSAPGPQKVVAKGRYSVLFAVAIAHAKYHEHTPLNQQASQMKRQGLAVKTNVLWEQTVHLLKHVRPTYDAIHIAALNEPVLGADETGYPMLEKGRELWQVLCLVSPNLSYLRIGRHKDTAAIVDLLSFPDTDTEAQTHLLSLPKTKKKGKPYAGGLMTDGAAVYGAAQRETSGTFQWGNCWSHARRYFLEAEPDYPKARKALDLIDKLFEIERDAVDLADELAKQAGVEIAKGSKTVPASVEQPAASIPVANPFLLEARARLRKSRSRPVLAKLKKWMRRSATSWDGSALNKAIRYVDDRWKHLRIFLSHPAMPIHNNASEFALRRPVMGRRRFCGIKSKLGADVAAIFYTLLETARKHGLDPLAYLYTVAVRAIENPGTVTLPWHITCGEVELLKPSD